jgi:hypothetical protein
MADAEADADVDANADVDLDANAMQMQLQVHTQRLIQAPCGCNWIRRSWTIRLSRIRISQMSVPFDSPQHRRPGQYGRYQPPVGRARRLS